jgi:hypothetical protein
VPFYHDKYAASCLQTHGYCSLSPKRHEVTEDKASESWIGRYHGGFGCRGFLGPNLVSLVTLVHCSSSYSWSCWRYISRILCLRLNCLLYIYFENSTKSEPDQKSLTVVTTAVNPPSNRIRHMISNPKYKKYKMDLDTDMVYSRSSSRIVTVHGLQFSTIQKPCWQIYMPAPQKLSHIFR